MSKFDVVIVGAGSAGLMSAQLIAKKGHKVALIERREDLLDLTFLTLGSFMDVKKYGFTEKVIASKITTGDFFSKSVSFTKKANSTNILHKEQIHRELIDKCKRYGVEIFSGQKVNEVEFNEDGSVANLLTDKDEMFTAKIFMDCTGFSGVISKKAGLQDTKCKLGVGVEYNVSYTGDPHKAVFLIGKSIAGGYGWIFPLGNNRAIAGFGSMKPSVIRRIKEALHQMLEDERIKEFITIDEKKIFGGDLPVTEVKTKFVRENLVCVGDSVSQVNPIVCEGYRVIIDAAIMASQAVIKSLEEEDLEVLSEYEEVWKVKYKNDYRYSKFLQKVLVKVTSNDILSDIAMLFLRSKRTITINKIMSGRFGLRELLLP